MEQQIQLKKMLWKKAFKLQLTIAVAERKVRIVARIKEKLNEEFRLLMGDMVEKAHDRCRTINQNVQSCCNLASTTKKKVKTILDSGAMANSGCSETSEISRLKTLEHPVEVRGCTGSSTVVAKEGEWDFETRHPKHNLTLQHVLDIPGSNQNLISVGCLDDAGLKTVFEKPLTHRGHLHVHSVSGYDHGKRHVLVRLQHNQDRRIPSGFD